MTSGLPSVSYIGHSTLLIEMDGTRVLTDPLLRDRLAHLHRHSAPPVWNELHDVDAVVISHMHLDHLDIPSLKQLGRDSRLIVPAGAGKMLNRRGFSRVDEVKPGETVAAGGLQVTATPAEHSGFRPPAGPSGIPLGFVIGGSRHVYFAGDTDIFPEMEEISGDLDVALIPIWGWGRKLGPGHLDPERAARALTLLRPSLAIPIHWGTFAARYVRRRKPSFLTEPPLTFAEYAARLAPEVTIKVLQPGERTTV